jgi:hypothetical protein
MEQKTETLQYRKRKKTTTEEPKPEHTYKTHKTKSGDSGSSCY